MDRNQQICAALVGMGILSHWAYFINIDVIDSSPTIALLFLTIPAVLTVLLNIAFSYSYLGAAFTATVWSASFIGGVFGSMVVYRLFFHRLRKYPGPAAARVTQWYHFTKIFKKMSHFREVDKMHSEYGEYVRMGPNLLSISDPDIVNVVHGPSTTFNKGNWYEGGKPLTTLHQMTDRAMHDKRRRHGWDKAFTTKSLRAYDPRLLKYTDQLMGQLRARAGSPVNASSWINYFAFDVMGDLAFGRSFKALEKGDSHFFIDLIHESAFFVGSLGQSPWVVHLISKLPIPPSMNSFLRMLKYSELMVTERKTYKPEDPDVMSHLLEAGNFFDDPKTEQMLLTGDARLLIIAGSDTTATTLTYFLYTLAKNPSLGDKLRAELAEHNIRRDDSFSVLALTPLDYLNSVINEILRLYPPVPGGLYRKAPKEGISVNGHFISGGCNVLTPQHTIQRCKFCSIHSLLQ